MASPIFISQSNQNLTLVNVLKGLVLSFKSTLILLQRRRLHDLIPLKFTVKCLVYSIVLHTVLYKIPLYLLSSYYDYTYWYDVLNIQLIVLIVLFTQMYHEFDKLFFQSLKAIDQQQNTHFHKLERLDDKYDLPGHYQWKLKDEIIKQRLKSLTFSLITLVFIRYNNHRIPAVLQDFLISLQISRYFNDKLGTTKTILLFFLSLYYLNFETILYIFSKFQIMVITTHTVLFKYFNKLQLSQSQKSQWCETRLGLIIGFTLPFITLSNHWPYLSIPLLLVYQITIASLVTQTTSPLIPDRINSDTTNWLLREIYYQKSYQQRTRNAKDEIRATWEQIIQGKDTIKISRNSGRSTPVRNLPGSVGSIYGTPISSTSSLNLRLQAK